MSLNSYDSYERAAEKGPLSLLWKLFLAGLLITAVLTGSGYLFGWCGEAAQVAHDEFGPKAAMQKYGWFKEQAAAIKKMDQDVVMFEQRAKSVDEQYASYGTDRAKWPLDVRTQYNHERQQVRDDLIAVASQRNNLVKDYNAAGTKFNWTPFQTNPDMPAKFFQEYVVK